MKNVNDLRLCYVRDHFAWFASIAPALMEGEDWDKSIHSLECGDPYPPLHNPRYDPLNQWNYTLLKVAWEGWLVMPPADISPHRLNELNPSVPWLYTAPHAPPDTPTALIHSGTSLLDFVKQVEAVGGTAYLPFGNAMTAKVAQEPLPPRLLDIDAAREGLAAMERNGVPPLPQEAIRVLGVGYGVTPDGSHPTPLTWGRLLDAFRPYLSDTVDDAYLIGDTQFHNNTFLATSEKDEAVSATPLHPLANATGQLRIGTLGTIPRLLVQHENGQTVVHVDGVERLRVEGERDTTPQYWWVKGGNDGTPTEVFQWGRIVGLPEWDAFVKHGQLLPFDDAYLAGNAQIYNKPTPIKTVDFTITMPTGSTDSVTGDEDTEPLPTLPPIPDTPPASMQDTWNSIRHMRGTSPLGKGE